MRENHDTIVDNIILKNIVVDVYCAGSYTGVSVTVCINVLCMSQGPYTRYTQYNVV